jgi:hypothetical protein
MALMSCRRGFTLEPGRHVAPVAAAGGLKTCGGRIEYGRSRVRTGWRSFCYVPLTADYLGE